MFQRYAVQFTIAGVITDGYTTALVDLEDGEPREIVAQQIACRRFGRAEMADHVELELTPIGAPSPTPRPLV